MISQVITVSPRGFCAGVARSINVVEDCLDIFGAPVYVKHAIVHNKTVVNDLEKKGAITVEEVSEIPEGAIAVFSAHGSPPEHYDEARTRGVKIIDATCPLVTKVHIEIVRYIKDGYKVIYVGHKGHVEGIGVLGEAKKLGIEVPLVDTIDDVQELAYPKDAKIVILTQTTLSIDETALIIEAIKMKYPNTTEPAASDICFATTNRQGAIKFLAHKVDLALVVGSVTSSNSNRLVEVARNEGIEAYLIDCVDEINESWLQGKAVVGLSAGASAPEYRVQEIVNFFVEKGAKASQYDPIHENMTFTEPAELTKAKAENTKERIQD